MRGTTQNTTSAAGPAAAAFRRNGRRALRLAAIAAAFPAGSASAGNTTANWNTATSGRWTIPTFWSTNPAFPNNGTPAGATYDVVVGPTGAPYTVTMDTGTIVVDSLALQSTNATLNLTGSVLTATNGITIMGGNFRLDGGLSGIIRSTSINSTVNNFLFYTGTLDAVTFTGGATIMGPPSPNGPWERPLIRNGLTLGTATTDGELLLSSVDLAGTQTIGGRGTITAGTLLPYDGTLTIGSGINFKGPSNVVIYNGSVINNGTFRLTDAGQRSTFLQQGNFSNVEFVNRGLIEALPGTTYELASPIDNTAGTIRAAGGVIYIGDGTLPQVSLTPSKFGNLEATNGGRFVFLGPMLNGAGTVTATATTGNIELAGATILGGRVATTGGARFFLPREGATFSAVTLSGTVVVGPLVAGNSAFLKVQQGMTLDGGTVSLAGAASGFGAIWAEGGTIGGSGLIRLDGGVGSNEIRNTATGSFGTLTLGPNVEVRTGTGGGSFYGSALIDNQGLISSETAGQKISLNGVRNSGRLYVRNGGTIEATSFDNRSTVILDGTASTLRLLSGWNNGSGGSINATAGATVNFAAPGTAFGAVRAIDSTLNFSAGTFSGISELSLVHSVIDLPTSATLDATGKSISLGNFSTLRLSGGGLVGVTLAGGATGGTVQVPASKTGTLTGVTVGVPVDVQGGGTLSIANGLTLDVGSVVSLNSGTTAATAAKLQLNSSATIAGSGSIVFNGAQVPGTVNAAGAAEIGAGVTVQTGTGSGSISVPSTLTNKGTIASKTFNQSLAISATSVVNQGRIVIDSNNSMVVPAVQNTGTIDVFGTGSLTLSGNWSNTGSGAINLARGTNLTLGGTFLAAGLTGVHFIIDNTGTVVTLAGTAQNAPGTTIDLAPFGAMRVGTGAAIVGGRVAGGSTGSLVATGPGSSLTLRDVTLAAPLSFPTGGTLNFEGAWSVATADGGSVNATAATINLGGSFRRADVAAITQTAGVVNFTGTLDNGGGALTLDNSTGTWNVNGGTVRGGTLKTAGSALFFVPRGQSATLDGVTLDTDLPLAGATLNVVTGLTFPTPRQITGTTGATVAFNGPAAQSVVGPGTFSFDATASNLMLNDGGGPAMLGPGVTVRAKSLTMHGGAQGIINRGSIIADPGGIVRLFDVTNDGGSVTVNNGAALTARGSLVFNPSSSLIVDRGSLTAGTLDLSGAGTFTFTGGRVEIDRGLLHPKGPAFVVPTGGALAGVGMVTGGVTNGGEVSPGRVSLAGTLTVAWDYVQSAAGTLHVDIGGTQPGTGHDVLSIGRTATLDGKLDLARAEGLVTTAGQSFTILSSDGLSGTFSSVSGVNTAGNGLSFATTYTPNSVVVTTALPGDVDLDQAVGPGDFSILASHFGNAGGSWSTGDLNGDGLVGPGDFSLLATNFGRSSFVGPTAGLSAEAWATLNSFGAANIPEPAGCAVIGLLAAGVLRRHRRL